MTRAEHGPAGARAALVLRVGDWDVYLHDRVSGIDAELWNEHCAGRHPFKDTSYLGGLERAYPARACRYAEIVRDGRIAGQFLLNENAVDPAMFAPAPVKAALRAIRRLWPSFLVLRLVTAGTMDTVGAHWWHDADALAADELADIMVLAARQTFPAAHLLVVRDLMDAAAGSPALAAGLARHDLVQVDSLPVAVVKAEGAISAHVTSLKRQMRQFVKKLPQLAQAHGLRIEHTQDVQEHLARCYALFLNVSNRAEELQRQEPVPYALFEELVAMPGTRLTLAWSGDGKLVGFVLTRICAGIACPAYVGLDYGFAPEARVYHQLMWAEISRCIEDKIGTIDLGVTSYFVKQGYGAVLQPCKMLVRFQGRWTHRILRKLIPVLTHVEQPRKRSTRVGPEVAVASGVAA